MSIPIPNSLLKPKEMAAPAAILSIGTANPTNIIDQSTYPEYFFRVTNSEHMTEFKQKFKRICEKSKIKKRHFVLTEKILEKNTNLFTAMEPSLAVRQEILSVELPKLGMEAAEKAIEEWGQPKSEITHLIFCTTSSVDLPGADYHLANMLNLDGSVNRLMLAQQGCAGGGTAIRLAKDIAENNRRARVLVVCVETSAVIFRGPNKARLDDIVGAAIFGDGASAVVISADAVAGKEKPIFRIISATQTVLPNSESLNISGKMRETGLTYSLSRDVPDVIAGNITEVLHKAFDEMTDGGVDWNSMFWGVHPGGPAILDRMEEKLGLNPEKLKASRHVLSEYGNMSSATVMFVLDEMRRRSTAEKMMTTGEGVELGVLLAFGPGITVELVVLQSVRI